MYLTKDKNSGVERFFDAFKFRQNKREGVAENSVQSVAEYIFH